jgi:prepilin-type N-terminal cleavage/methylation domain-containing protein/prepilin-type processing-associated H-X9-DG protein
MRASSRNGFTLVELLVVILIIGVLLALLLPAVQQARESAHATQCRNNLRQMGIALHNYHSIHNAFPSGCVGTTSDPVNIQGWGWAAFLLPYLEEGPLYADLNPQLNTLPTVLASTDMQPLLRTSLSVFRCASDDGQDLNDARTFSGFTLPHDFEGGGPVEGCLNPFMTNSDGYGIQAAMSNYVASFGDYWVPDGSAWSTADFAGNGVFGSNVTLRMRDITDGASATFAIGERSWQSFASVWPGTDGWNRCEREGVPMVMATAFYPMNMSPEPYNLSCDPKGAAGYSSMHPGGANFLMVDGSVRFVSDSINFANDSDPKKLGVFQKLARRNDGQPVGEF